MKMKHKVLVAAVLLMALVLAGCQATTPTPTPAPVQTTPGTATETPGNATQSPVDTTPVTAIGSTSMENLILGIGDLYKDAKGISVQVTGNGSSAGIKAAADGTADVGMSSRELKQEEKDQGLVGTVAALDAIAVIVHPDNPVKDLTVEQISKIYRGEITNWSELGGRDATIMLVTREAGSGTRGAFEELCDLLDEKVSAIREDLAIVVDSTNGVAQNVAGKPDAIGYVSLGSLNDTVSAVAVGGVACTVENTLDGSYVISRPFLLVTKGEPQGKALEFINFVLSQDGQAIVKNDKFIPVA